MANVKCKFCKTEIDKSIAYNPKPKIYYCNQECCTKQENKSKYKPSKTKSNGEPNDRRLLTDYIQELYINEGWDKYSINWSLICKQIQNIQKDNPKLTYNWIRYVLWYLVEIKQQNLFGEFDGSILNLVPFTYIEAYNYWKQTKETKTAIQNFELNDNKCIVVKSINKKHIDINF